MLLVPYPRNHWQIQCHKVSPLCFLLSVLSSYVYAFDPLKLTFVCLGKVKIECCIFASEYKVCPIPFLEKTVIFPTEWSWFPGQKKSADHRLEGFFELSVPFH